VADTNRTIELAPTPTHGTPAAAGGSPNGPIYMRSKDLRNGRHYEAEGVAWQADLGDLGTVSSERWRGSV